MEERKLKFYDRMVGKFGKNHIVLRIMLDVIRAFFKFVALPGIRSRHSWASPKLNSMAALPINQELYSQSVPLPLPVLTEIIEKASHRMLMNVCGCRVAYSCKNHDPEIGCIFMGPAVLNISPGLGRLVSAEEALEHTRKAIENGLVPCVGKSELDKTLFIMPKDAKFIGLCYCCHCCCIAGDTFKDLPLEQLNKIFPRMEGLEIEITDDCSGCGTCVDACLYKAITIEDGRAVHSEMCRGCGRCALQCPSNAIEMSLDNPNFKDAIISRISEVSGVI